MTAISPKMPAITPDAPTLTTFGSSKAPAKLAKIPKAKYRRQNTEGKISKQETNGAKSRLREAAPCQQADQVSGEMTEASVQEYGGHNAPRFTIESQPAEIAAPGRRLTNRQTARRASERRRRG
jgi:hypothetical protein